MSNERTVYMLGAGCSKDAGFPLADEFLRKLEGFLHSLNDEADCTRIKQCVGNTIARLHATGTTTVDRLLTQEFQRDQGLLTEDEGPAQDARIATSSLLLHLESRANLERYEVFLNRLFPSIEDWFHRPPISYCNVVTFNYDRLFEMAFLRRFYGHQSLDDPSRIYRREMLNSGLLTGDYSESLFSFLKLHGSVGISLTGPTYALEVDNLPINARRKICDHDFFPVATHWTHKGSIPARADDWLLNRVPLIVFPKDSAKGNIGRYLFGDPPPFYEYRNDVWERAKSCIDRADVLIVIGFSFSKPIREFALNLLRNRRNTLRVIIQAPHPYCMGIVNDLRDESIPRVSVEADPAPF